MCSHSFTCSLSANIITRGPRSLGYGFVEFETDELAKKAVDMMNHKEVDGRPINVEVAQRRDPNAYVLIILFFFDLSSAPPQQQQPHPRGPPRQFRGPPMYRNYAMPGGFVPQMQPMPRGRRGQEYMGMAPQMMGFVPQPVMGFGGPRPQRRQFKPRQQTGAPKYEIN